MIRVVRPGRARGTARIPGSKSYTHRFLIAAGLSSGPVRLAGALDADDTRATVDGLRRLGASVRTGSRTWAVRPIRPAHRGTPTTIDCRESGTTLRLLLPVAALQDRPYRFVGRGRLPERPIGPLISSLRALGATIEPEHPRRSLPVRVRGPIRSGDVSVEAGGSSQPASGLALALGSLESRARLTLVGAVVSRPYLEATGRVLRAFGGSVRMHPHRIDVTGPLRPPADVVSIPPDASSAAYAWAAAAISGGSIRVPGFPEGWPQADLAILRLLERMGATIARGAGTIAVRGPLRRGIRTDLTASPDLYPLAAVLACAVPGARSRLSGAPHLRHKESDRLAESLRIARALGATARIAAGGALEIVGPPTIEPFSLPDLFDHRLVMSAAVGALAARGPCRIGDAASVAKSFPGFWNEWAEWTGAESRS